MGEFATADHSSIVKTEGASAVDTIKAASAAIFTAHNMTGLDDVTSHSFVQAVRS